jgi:hypothetical protein
MFSTLPVMSSEAYGGYKLAPKFVRVTTNILGYNFIAKHVAQGVVKKTLNKNIKGDYNVKFSSFSGVDLKKGKFKGFTIEGKNLCLDDEVYFSRMYLKTTSDFNYVQYNKKPPVFKTDVPMDYEVEITEDDLNKTVSSANSLNAIAEMIPLVSFEKIRFSIYDGRLHIKTGVKIPFCKTIRCSLSTGLEVNDGKIVFSDIEAGSLKNDLADKIVNLMNNYNLLDNITVRLFEGAKTNMTVKNIKIVDSTIYINGNVTIKKA